MKIFLFLVGVLTFNFANAAAEKPIECQFPTKDGNSSVEKCLIKSKNGELSIIKTAKAKLAFDPRGLVSGSVAGYGCYWLNKKGVLQKAYCFDNGADYFQDGLARHVDASGKFGFMNEKLQLVIPAKYTFAYPFEYGFSKVCMKCKEKKMKGSEHGFMEGGNWSVIDKTGKSVKQCKGAKREDRCSPPLM